MAFHDYHDIPGSKNYHNTDIVNKEDANIVYVDSALWSIDSYARNLTDPVILEPNELSKILVELTVVITAFKEDSGSVTEFSLDQILSLKGKLGEFADQIIKSLEDYLAIAA